MSKSQNDNAEVKIFQEYLRIESVHPDVDYSESVSFLRKQAEDLKLPCQVTYPGGPTKPMVLMSWIGTNPSLPSILLNSHMDVVPVFPEHWSYPPFSAHIDETGKIFARGTQDMKSVGMQYLAAIRAFKKEGKTFKRSIHILFCPDEEIGGFKGMMEFVKTKEFKSLNVGCALDEGGPSPTNVVPLHYGERFIWRIKFKFHGTTGHGALLHKNTAFEKFHYVMGKITEFRRSQIQLLETNPNLSTGDVTTLNVTMLNGGVLHNVVPATMECLVDCRIAINVDPLKFENMIRTWCKEAGEGAEVSFPVQEKVVLPTKLDATNKYWVSMKAALDKKCVQVKPTIFYAITDSRYLRSLGIPCFGFSPLAHTPVLLHDHNEYVTVDTFLKGIEIYKEVIGNLASLD